MRSPYKKLLMRTLVGLVLLALLIVFAFQKKSPAFPDVVDPDIYKFTEVIDGDTLAAWREGEERILIRMIGINAPETGEGFRQEECFGKESTEHLKELIDTASTVRVTTDPTQDTYDRYDRLLAYIWIDEININEQMIRDGYAYEYTYSNPYQYQQDFRSAQKTAQHENLGLWTTCQ
ncbi:thermonuclease family protein [Candidatus Nomurabacteria bacterium]|nr:thermonuclease family protein [Candidatus Nomurabacteria bacterium]